MAKYLGITIGPIGDTMSLTSTPAGLWAASYLFSYLAHEIRKCIGKDDLLQDELEYKDGLKVRDLFSRGVGLYHDRIIYPASEKFNLDHASQAVREAVRNVVRGFQESTIAKESGGELQSFFNEYLNIHIVCIDVEDGENALLKVNDALDTAELEKNFPSEIGSNPILRLFEGDGEGSEKNKMIKNSFLVHNSPEWVMLNQGQIKDLPTIALSEKGTYTESRKASRYYAVIRADGDNMGRYIKEKVKNDEDYLDFSKKCYKYGCRTASIVLGFGGIPIYVGGDDLLCICPLMCGMDEVNGNKVPGTFLDMIKKIREAFFQEFPNPDSSESSPNLSFGVQIQYVKAPLYEALSESGMLLFGTAKNNKPGAVAINLRKHSGQSAEILIKNIGRDDKKEKGKSVFDQLNLLIKKHASENTLHSVGMHISEHAALCNQAAAGENCLDNFFDNVIADGSSVEDIDYIECIKTLAKQINHGRKSQDLANILCAYIRLIMFFSEKTDDEER